MATKQILQYRMIVDRVEGLAGEMSSETCRISDICKIVGVSQRMLRRAFHRIHGMAPFRYMHMLRMNEARKALSSPSSSDVTVTQIATDYGFLELGRFSVEYRLKFGECPSVTLRRALISRKSVPKTDARVWQMSQRYQAHMDNSEIGSN